MNTFERIELLLEDDFKKLQNATVLIIGIGGVGSYAAESLARSGVKHLILVDKDYIVESNLNRQLHATYDTIGILKTTAMKKRIHSYNKDCIITEIPKFYNSELNNELFQYDIDFVIDAIDTISSKFELIKTCLVRKIPFVSSMGMGNRIDASMVRSGFLDETTYCPVAKQIRKLVKKQRILRRVPVIYSLEQPITQSKILNNSEIRKEKMPPASIIFPPATAGMMAASMALKSILKKEETK